MKYPSDPNVGLVNGKFSDGDPANGIAASRDPAAHLNAITDELLAAITNSGLTASEADTTQLYQALAILAARGDFYTEAGAADAYVLSPSFTGFAPAAYATGMQVRFIPANTNTGASTINVNALGVKTITTQAGAVLSAGDLTAGRGYILTYEGASFALIGSYAPPAAASQAEAEAGTVTALRMWTPERVKQAAIAFGFWPAGATEAHSFAASGYQKLPSGLIIQWGSQASATTGTVTFPLAFPTACQSVQMTSQDSIRADKPATYSYTQTTFVYSVHNWDTAPTANPVTWIAIGY